jgi:hypothetical protein
MYDYKYKERMQLVWEPLPCIFFPLCLGALLSLQVDLITLIVAFSYLFYIHFPCPRLLDDNYNIIQGIVVMVDNGNSFMKVIGPLDRFVAKVLR